MTGGVTGTVYVVHCVDTEGPLHESLDATFQRLREIFKLDLEPSADTLRRLQSGAVDLGDSKQRCGRSWIRTFSRTTTRGTKSTRCSPTACPPRSAAACATPQGVVGSTTGSASIMSITI